MQLREVLASMPLRQEVMISYVYCKNGVYGCESFTGKVSDTYKESSIADAMIRNVHSIRTFLDKMIEIVVY